MRDQKLTTASEIAVHIQHLIPNIKSGTLRFWGVWFGRPYDNWHTIVRAEAEGDCLTLYFNEEERLRVWHPTRSRIDSQQFVIQSATRVLWNWYYYGRPHTVENLKSQEFIKEGERVAFKTTFPDSQNEEPSPLEPAVQIY